MIFDKNNNVISVGSLVKVLSIEENFILTFPDNEAEIMKKMISHVFKVTSIEHGKALVYQPFNKYKGFSLALSSEEMELIKKH